MSDYPSTPHYGANYGSTPYIQPTYPNQYSQPDDGHMGQHNYGQNYDANMSAYNYNGAIPGFNATALASAAPPLPIYQGWNQDPNSLPPYSAPQNTMQHNGYAANSYNNYAQQYPPVPQHGYQQNIPPPTKAFDEGEVSEGEFEARYAPQNPPTVDYNANQYGGNGYVDTAHRAVYARTQDPPPLQAALPGNEYSYPREPPHVRRQQSGSYSPFAPSPRAEDRDERSIQKQSYNTSTPNHIPEKYVNSTAQAQNKSAWEQNGNRQRSRSSSRANGNRDVKRKDSPAAKDLPAPIEAASVLGHIAKPLPVRDTAQVPVLNATPVHSTPQKPTIYDKLGLRKQAQSAILNLLPHDIRFEKYVEEGIADDIVGSLFDDLRVSRASSKLAKDASLPQKLPEVQPTTGTASHISPQGVNGISLPPKPEVQPLDNTLQGIPPTAPFADRTDKSISSAAVSTSPPTTTTNAAKSAASTEKERTLQMKMEALRKSREERAQKAAAKNNVKSSSVAVTAPVLESEKPNPTPTTHPSDLPSTSPLPSLQQPPIQPVISQTPSKTLPTPQPQTIPGLFLASTAASPAPSMTNGTMYGTQNSTRKRPVAADFDTPPTVTPYKRPFGHSRSDTPLVIDVSEEDNDSEDEDVAMDLDSQADQDSPIQPPSKLSDQRNSSIQNLPALTNFPVRKPFTPPPVSSAASTPPVFPPTRKATLGRPEVLQEKEMQIEELRRKIAEAEAAKAQKKAQQSASGTQTPRRLEINNNNTSIASNDSMAKKVEASLQMQNMINVADERVNSNQKRLVEAHAIEQEEASELKKQEAERKRLRRSQIATDLPRVDAAVLEKQRKLELLKAQMAEIEAEVQKNLADKQRMAEEMEKLGQEAEDQLQAQKDKLKDLTSADNGSNTDQHNRFAASSPAPAPKTNILSAVAQNTDGAQPFPSLSKDSYHPVVEVEAIRIEREPSIPSRNDDPLATSMDHDRPMTLEDGPSGIESGETKDNVTADQDLEAALQEAVRIEADSHDARREDVAMDIEESYAPDPNQLVPNSASNALEEGDRSPSYSPVLERVVPSMSDRQSDVDYEPPDVTSPIDNSRIQSPPFSPAPAEPIVEEADDLVVFGNNPGSSLDTDENETVQSPLPQTNGSVPVLIQDTSSDDKVQFYAPYESPLKDFRAFRFHPEFNREVPGGFRSLTYSHKIDPNVELCHWEMSGGTCNDKTCELQHFRNIGLPDDVVLSALGSPDEFKGEQRKLFCDGLKEVLSSLRARKERDFNVIAKEVVAHRARFLGDSSKVLMLDDTSI